MAHDGIVVDLETCPMDGADAYVPPPPDIPRPDLDVIQAAKNLRDPVKIAEDIEKRRADATVAWKNAYLKATLDFQDRLSKAALDFNLARIVALGWTNDRGGVAVHVAESEAMEAQALRIFWDTSANRPLIGFRIRTFDAPMLMARSRFLGVRHPQLDLSRYSRGGRITDLWDVLTYGLSDYETTSVMPRRLKTYATRYGLTVADDIDGADIPALIAAGEWDKVVAHVTSDVQLTAALAVRLGVMRDQPVVAPA